MSKNVLRKMIVAVMVIGGIAMSMTGEKVSAAGDVSQKYEEKTLKSRICTNGDYKTYLYMDDDYSKPDNQPIVSLAKKDVAGEKPIQGLQGMAVMDDYMYSCVMDEDEKKCIIYRTDYQGNTIELESYYKKTEGGTTKLVKQDYLTELGHANGCEVVDIDGIRYMLVGTSKDTRETVAVLQLDGKKAIFLGHIGMKDTASNYNKISALRVVGKNSKNIYMAVKYNNHNVCFYYSVVIPKSYLKNPASNNADLICYKLFQLDLGGAYIVDENNKLTYLYELAPEVGNSKDTIGNQEFCYVASENKIYCSFTDSTNTWKESLPSGVTNEDKAHAEKIDSFILMFDVKDYFDYTKWSGKDLTDGASGWNKILPETTSIRLKLALGTEIEACGFRQGTGISDKSLYFQAQWAYLESEKAAKLRRYIFRADYEIGKENFQSMTYKVKYEPYGGTGNMPDSVLFRSMNTRYTSLDQYQRNNKISMKFIANKFTKKDQEFRGWYVYRYNSSGQKQWLYSMMSNGKEVLGWYGYGKQPKKARYKVYADEARPILDVGNAKEIHCVADWAPANLKEENQFVIKYDGNGASGSMSDTVVTYGKYTKLSKNTFTRTGYKFSGWCAYNETTDKWYVIRKKDEVQEWVTDVTDDYYDQAYADQAAVAKTAHPGEVVTLYAQWAKVIYEHPEGYTITCGSDLDVKADVISTNDFYDLTIGYQCPMHPELGRATQVVMKKNTYSFKKSDLKWLDFPNLPAGEYVFYVDARAVHYFPNFEFYHIALDTIPIIIKHDCEAKWYADGTQHWRVCKGCGEKDDVAKHSGGKATCTEKAKCATCGKEYGSTKNHTYGTTWKTDGTNHWRECTVCGAKKDNAAHTLKTTITQATTAADGKKVTKCIVCNKVTKTETIYAANTITLSTTSYTYDGKAKKPAVAVKDSNGKTVAEKNYTVTYTKGRKAVGEYSVKVTFKGDYSGSKTLKFTINPKATTIKSVTAAKQGFTVKWAKRSKEVTGYEIQYATNSKFTAGLKKRDISKNTTVSKKITKLDSKKTYYIRIRTYKTVGSKKYTSAWSKVSSVKTK